MHTPFAYMKSRLRRALDSARLTLSLPPETLVQLESLAGQADLAPEELAAELLTQAVAAQTQELDDNLRRWNLLSGREQQAAALACLGYTNPQIAARLHLAPDTVKVYLGNAIRKFGLKGRRQLAFVLRDWDFSAYDQAG
jgi:DNA-binding NarL/FixJ family response regulator